ncbi:hypothetical protein [Amycolatopsis nalaikhensis]|uniref:Uncharacterized protein n=1 Tax=Amycolatopsis nalaikhensis TaxID=715472 RepID=A0ABY8XFN2_9PSEU|nr:hypothetical protein [Amycolatopsis sp. 2-2]WIV54440.1 hypothetical protein QP939_37120 [Amycolatopsis sp. 2-2]
MVHFLLAEDLVRAREAELRQTASHAKSGGRRETRRQRLGWLLIESGLKLVASPARHTA